MMMMIIQGFSNSMIFQCMELFFGDFPGFPELVGTLDVLPTLDFLTILAVVLFHEAKKNVLQVLK